MAAYIIVDVQVKDPVGYEDYKRMVGPTLAQYGGKFIVRGGTCTTLEGGWEPGRAVVLEFESVERARQWYTSPEYEPAKQLRFKYAESKMILVEGA